MALPARVTGTNRALAIALSKRCFAAQSETKEKLWGVHSSLDLEELYPVPSMLFSNQRNIVNEIRPVDKEMAKDWFESLQSVVEHSGPNRARFLLHMLLDEAARLDVAIGQPTITPFYNTIPSSQEKPYPGDMVMEKKICNIIRWNAAVMVSDANKRAPGVGGHIGTFAGIADFIEVLQNHFLRGKEGDGMGDSLYVQGHSSPGTYARAFLEGRLSINRILNFRQEVKAGEGLSSYPHPRLMPDFWENPTVSMGLGPLVAAHQARYFRYLHMRGLKDTANSRVWCFIGDGEMDEAETVSAIAVGGRERLNNLCFIVNCNYQRLDGPVRGNSKVIQEFEGLFRGAGYDVIKLVWGSTMSKLIDEDHDGQLIEVLETMRDGDAQRLSAKNDGALIRKEIFEDHGLGDRVSHLKDADLVEAWNVPAGHDWQKIYAALDQAAQNAESGTKPTVILAKTLKGFGLETFQGRNIVHQKKSITDDELRKFRDQMKIPLTDDQIVMPDDENFFRPPEDSAEIKYLKERRAALGGYYPVRVVPKISDLVPELPGDDVYSFLDKGSARPMSTTMAWGQLLRRMMKSGDFGKRVVPIITDEARTFGLEGLFKEFKIYAATGQHYVPQDHTEMLKYAEAPNGQLLQEGISEAGAMSTWIAAGSSYSSQHAPTLPFFVYYSMFGWQRVADLIWQAADTRCRGFLMGATAGRTTLNGEGLQHQDGHSLLTATTCPAVRAWDPAFSWEVSSIIKNGVDEMWGKDKDVIYYIMIYNENLVMPEKPAGAHIDEQIVKGMYKYREAPAGTKHTVRLLGSGCIMQQVLDAAEVLKEKYDVGAEIWSVTSYGELHRDAVKHQRARRLNPTSTSKPWVEECLGDGTVTIATSDYQTALPELLRRWVGGEYEVLGTDGFGRSDTREALRRFFEIDSEHVVLASLSGLAKAGALDASVVAQAMEEMGIDTDRPDICEIDQ